MGDGLCKVTAVSMHLKVYAVSLQDIHHYFMTPCAINRLLSRF